MKSEYIKGKNLHCRIIECITRINFFPRFLPIFSLDDAINVLRNHADFQGLPPMSTSQAAQAAAAAGLAHPGVIGANGSYGHLDDGSLTDPSYQLPHQSDAGSPPLGLSGSGKKRKAGGGAASVTGKKRMPTLP